jgi:anti-anti-sigma factor
MEIRQESAGDVIVLALAGKITGEGGRHDLHETIKRLTQEGHRKVLLDFQDVAWINSNGLGQIIAGCHSLCREGGQLKLCNVHDRAKQMLEVCQLHVLLDVQGTREKAMVAFG